MLQKNKSCNECSCFERSEKVFQDKMDTWRNCGCTHNDRCCTDAPCTNIPPYDTDECEENYDMELAMAYVKSQQINLRTVKNCDDALEAGTMFDELDKPFTAGGKTHDTY
ncbi:MAG: spore coat associated protein CotJA [Erysipelotrichaceae bacterium]|nr:spore coat associated protein CotJA [Erysipelotrichaceae bacterium]